MKYVTAIRIGVRYKWRFFKWLLPRKVMMRVKQKGNKIEYAKGVRGKALSLENFKKVINVRFVYPWDVMWFRIIRMRGKDKELKPIQEGLICLKKIERINNHNRRLIIRDRT